MTSKIRGRSFIQSLAEGGNWDEEISLFLDVWVILVTSVFPCFI